jgi:acyl dehydratase
LQLRTRLQPEPVPDDGARWVQVEVEFDQDGQLVARGESRYLAKRGARSAPVPRAAEAPPGELITRWTLDAGAGRRYARLSGDWNPIHLWPATARLFGFRQPIIHGMHSAASAEAALDRLSGRPTQSLQIEFKRPVPLGSEVELWADLASGDFALLVQGGLVARGHRR